MDYSRLECYCLFAGYPRSGHSLVGSIVDAHRYMMLGDEIETTTFAMEGHSQEYIFDRLVARSKKVARTYIDSWQRNCKELRVIGDKPRPPLAWSLKREKPWRVDPTAGLKLLETIQIPVKIVHVLRNPFDTIAAIKIHNWTNTLDEAANLFFSTFDANMQVREMGWPWTDVYLEGLIHSPKEVVGALCDFLEQDAPPDYLAACAEAIWLSPRRRTSEVEWPAHLTESILFEIGQRPLLSEYDAL